MKSTPYLKEYIDENMKDDISMIFYNEEYRKISNPKKEYVFHIIKIWSQYIKIDFTSFLFYLEIIVKKTNLNGDLFFPDKATLQTHRVKPVLNKIRVDQLLDSKPILFERIRNLHFYNISFSKELYAFNSNTESLLKNRILLFLKIKKVTYEDIYKISRKAKSEKQTKDIMSKLLKYENFKNDAISFTDLSIFFNNLNFDMIIKYPKLLVKFGFSTKSEINNQIFDNWIKPKKMNHNCSFEGMLIWFSQVSKLRNIVNHIDIILTKKNMSLISMVVNNNLIRETELKHLINSLKHKQEELEVISKKIARIKEAINIKKIIPNNSEIEIK